jgi:SAM-dependent methyltransferase
MAHFLSAQHFVHDTAGSLVPQDDYGELLRSDFASHYTDSKDVWTWEPAMREPVRALLSALPGGGNAHVLDVGSGRAVDTRILLDGGYRVTSIDLIDCPEWTDIGVVYGDRVSFRRAGLLDLRPVAEFDAVLDNGCMHHQHPDVYVQYLRRIHDVLMPTGVFALSVFQAGGDSGGLYVNDAGRLYREFTRAELTELVRSTGFELVEVHEVPRAVADLNYLVMIARKANQGSGRHSPASWE